ncbi:zinc metalloprotease [Allokutzneria albata]|uniref:IrrE N-terminal-like domain-containing protein n=1 Tax=Allokutzneria albata TaxID=211114 RepID=A0A1G9Y643_ALLAB|nr:hypothetical protein [Allokutzneria albata]SDN04528.1 hypothetical protein SAMN04489726_4624 [Allokutzneria albata]
MLNQLELEPPLDVTELCKRLSDIRELPIRLVAHPLNPRVAFGAWVRTSRADYILFQQETSRAHQDHIILHELGHILAGHHSSAPSDVEQPSVDTGGLQERYPDLLPEVVDGALRRNIYDSADECEAETLATILLEWASVVDRAASRPSLSPATRRMDTVLTDRLGWL